MIIFHYLLWIILYSCAGWIYESIICSIDQKKLVNRGFLNGPLCPIYGFGAIFIIIFLSKKPNNLLELFVTGSVLASIVEYITAYFLEKLFKAKWWDYSNYRFNIHGRVCLLGAMVFGIFSVVIIEYVQPLIEKFTNQISDRLIIATSTVVLIIIIIDIWITVAHLLSLNGRLKEIQGAINLHIKSSKEFSDGLKDNFENVKINIINSRINREDLKESFDENIEGFKIKVKELKYSAYSKFENSEYYTENVRKLLNVKKFQDKRIAKAFPNMKSIKYNEAWEKVKSRIEQKWNK